MIDILLESSDGDSQLYHKWVYVKVRKLFYFLLESSKPFIPRDVLNHAYKT